MYSLLRYLTHTGEETVAFTRPLTPTTVKHALRNDWGISTFGTDLQILDTGLGVTDVNYGSAWQLGKDLVPVGCGTVAGQVLHSGWGHQLRADGCHYQEIPGRLHDGDANPEIPHGPPLTLRGKSSSQAGMPLAPDDYSHGSALIMETCDIHCLDAATTPSRSTEADRIVDDHNTEVHGMDGCLQLDSRPDVPCQLPRSQPDLRPDPPFTGESSVFPYRRQLGRCNDRESYAMLRRQDKHCGKGNGKRVLGSFPPEQGITPPNTHLRLPSPVHYLQPVCTFSG